MTHDPNDPTILKAALCEAIDRADTAERQLHEAHTALDQLLEAVRYVREPHHLNHAEECSLCHIATDMLDGAAERARSALSQPDPTCEHDWIDIRNQAVESGETCRKCNAVRAGNRTTQSAPNTRERE